MASCFENITLFRYNDSTKQFEPLIQPNNLKLEFSIQQRDLILYISNPKTTETIHIQLPIAKISSFRISALQIVIDNSEIRKIGTIDLSNFLLEFISESDLLSFVKKLSGGKSTGNKKSTIDNSLANQFDNRTEKWSATQYFQFYSYLSQQQNMMQDYVRTATYQRAVLANCADFRNKVVLDVGAGSGILSFFAAQAGAKKVYAVEASNMARFCEQLVHNNKLAGKIIVMSGKIEEVVIPEPVDVLISEPMGYMLFNERMLETYVHARKFLRAAPVMFPTVANLYIAPFTDESLYMEQASKSNFWFQQAFHGVDLSSVRESANRENFSQPIVDTFDVGVCMAAPIAHRVDFRTVEENELQEIEIPLKFTFQQTGCCHGLAVWFDVGFLGSAKDVWLSTGPTEPLTHWYQVRCLFVTPLFVYEGQNVVGRMVMVANARQSYDVEIELSLPGTSCRVANTLDLKNPYFRYTGQPVQPPPGNQTKPPTENYFNIYNSHNNQSDNAMDYNQQSTVIASDIIQSSPMKNPTISWSAAGESFNSIPQPTNFSFLQTNNSTTTNNNNSINASTSNNVTNIGEYAPLSPFPKTTDEDDNWDVPKHI